jgi:uncharacterized C2H2 Zn-finger protein
MNTQYIYLLQEREFIKTKESIYKIGKTKQENNKRFNNYPNGSILLLQIICIDCDKCENLVMKLFKSKYIHCKEIGNEYFKGDYKEMINDIYNIIYNENNDIYIEHIKNILSVKEVVKTEETIKKKEEIIKKKEEIIKKIEEIKNEKMLKREAIIEENNRLKKEKMLKKEENRLKKEENRLKKEEKLKKSKELINDVKLKKEQNRLKKEETIKKSKEFINDVKLKKEQNKLKKEEIIKKSKELINDENKELINDNVSEEIINNKKYKKYECSSCFKIFKQKIDYTRHINKKNKCISKEIKNNIKIMGLLEQNKKIINNLTCNNCLKIFSRSDSLSNHIKLNKCINIRDQLTI